MSTDYSSQKVAELQDLLKARGLPHTGKKADLIARLEAADSEKPETTTDQSSTTAEADGSLEQQGGTTSKPSKPAQTQSKTPAPVAEAQSTETKPTSDAAAAEEDSAGAALPAVSLEQEIEKRRKRAERFGTGKPATESTDAAKADGDKASTDAQKLLDRQKRFGGVEGDTNVAGLDALNQALPERQRKRGRQGGADVEREGKRRDSRRREGGDSEGKGAAKAAVLPAGKKTSSEQAERDRLAAEKRKARFATNKATAAS